MCPELEHVKIQILVNISDACMTMLRCLLDHSTFDCLINKFALDVQLPVEGSSGGRFARGIMRLYQLTRLYQM